MGRVTVSPLARVHFVFVLTSLARALKWSFLRENPNHTRARGKLYSLGTVRRKR